MNLFENYHSIRVLGVYRIKHRVASWNTAKRNFSVLSYRLDGNAEFMREGKLYHVAKNNILYVPANIEYSQNSQGESLIAVHFQADDCTDSDIDVIKNGGEDFSELFLTIFRKWNEGTTESKYYAVSMIYRLFSLLSEAGKNDSRISAGINYIKSNYKSSLLTVREAAEKAFVSEVFFRRAMKESLGLSPNKYINTLRIEAAKELLDCGYYSVLEVSELCGFSELKYFSYVFKKFTGVTATEYKKNHLERNCLLNHDLNGII